VITPRPYQSEAVAALEGAHDRGVVSPAAVMATGLGKTVVFSVKAQRWIAELAAARRRGRRVVVLAHRTELVGQAQEELHDVAPELRSGIVMGTRNQTLHDVVCASPQTLNTPSRRRQLLDVGLVIVDECHHYAAPSFREVIRHFTDQGALAIGVTATMGRQDGRSLAEVWQEVVFTRDIHFGVQHGYLVKPVGIRVKVDALDLRTVRRRGKDYDTEALGEALVDSLAPKRIAEALLEHAPTDCTVIFAPSIASADAMRDACREAGLTAESVNYKTPPAERRAILAAHKDGSLQVVCNSMVLTEGWNNPRCRVAVIARQPAGDELYQQMVGRVLRPFIDPITGIRKTSALVLDVTGCSRERTLQAQINLFGAEYAEQDEREPCKCWHWSRDGGEARFGACSCPRNRCGDACPCAGSKCTCTWPDPLELVEQPAELYVDGTLQHEAVDLFHGSRNAWLQTRGGTWFIAAGERFIAILPAARAGHWDVLAMHRTRPRDPAYSRWVMRDVADLGFAQAWAEGDVTPQEHTTAAKGRSWRGRRPDSGMLQQASRYGIVVDEGAYAGEVVNAISIAQASDRIDRQAAHLRSVQHGA
jgi:superfamily II DNA or RNA helicase